MLEAYIAAFPMTPLGGAFILPVGLCIILGAAMKVAGALAMLGTASPPH